MGLGFASQEKKKPINNVRMVKNIVCYGALIKCKVSPTLDLLSQNLSTDLEDEHGSKARGTWTF